MWILELVQCIDIPLSVRDRTAHAMSSFASSPHRRKVSAVEIQGLTNGFIQEIFGQDKIVDCPSVGNLIELHNKVAPTFWIPHEAAQIESILTEQKGIVFAMSKKEALPIVCAAAFHIHTCLREENTGYNHCIILTCGLRWLRNALSSSKIGSQDEMITFDNTESISRVIDGHLEDDEYWGRESIFYCPKFAALTLIFILEKSLGFVEGVLPDLCS